MMALSSKDLLGLKSEYFPRFACDWLAGEEERKSESE
jgi:hypothetical protein